MRSVHSVRSRLISFVFFNATASTEIYTLSLHDALPISAPMGELSADQGRDTRDIIRIEHGHALDRKSTRLNSSHVEISYAVFCVKKKNAEPILVITAFISPPPTIDSTFRTVDADSLTSI